MKFTRVSFALAAALTFSLSSSTVAQAQLAIPDEVVILRGNVNEKEFHSRVSEMGAMASVSKRSDVATIRLHSSPNGSVAALSKGDIRELEAMCDELERSGVATVCSPNFVRRKSTSIQSADPEYYQLWGIERIATPAAWATTEGSRSVVVGVIDTGIDIAHPDFDQNIWTNQDEVPDDGIDNDGNGYVDDVHGYNFIDDVSSPMDGEGHGTHVAGTIGARKDNNFQVAGVSPQVSMMAVKVLDDEGSGSVESVVEGLLYAAANGAQVVNMSLGSSDYSRVELVALRRAQLAGVLVLAAAGNDAANNDSVGSYPANYPLRNILSVAATNSGDQLAEFSNYGPRSVHISAPGEDIYSLAPGGSAQMLSGTSMATPHVTGVAALMLAANPDLSTEDLRNGLLAGGEYLDQLWDYTITGVLLNARDAVAQALQLSPSGRGAPAALTSLKVKIAKKSNAFDVTVTSNGFSADSADLTAIGGITASVTCKEQSGKKKTLRKKGTTKEGRGSVTVRINTRARVSCYASSGLIVSGSVKSK